MTSSVTQEKSDGVPTTPAGVERYQRHELRPLPMRISQNSYERLERLRAVDDITVQEHVRRAIDYYLDHVEISLALAASPDLVVAAGAVRDARGASPELVPGVLREHAPRPVRTPLKTGVR